VSTRRGAITARVDVATVLHQTAEPAKVEILRPRVTQEGPGRL